MKDKKRISSVLVSVYYKDGLDEIVRELQRLNIKIYATGGSRDHIEASGAAVTPVEDVTAYPSILGGRVKTLHPKIFGGILGRREVDEDQMQLESYEIPAIDLVLVDLYPFEETLQSGATEQELIEKIDIGGISLIRAAAKNFSDVLIIPDRKDYPLLMEILQKQNGESSLAQRKEQAGKAFQLSSAYDSSIAGYFGNGKTSIELRYGENPHQKGRFEGNLDEVLEQLGGKSLSYNNFLDIDAAMKLIAEFSSNSIAIIKHNNACGLASDPAPLACWKKALAGDPVSAFGGVIITNFEVDKVLATEINALFFEVLIAPSFSSEALTILSQKQNRIILKSKKYDAPGIEVRTALNGQLVQDADGKTENTGDMRVVTEAIPNTEALRDLVFANKIVKHSKSNAIVLAKNEQLLASGVGQTSRVDALNHAIEKARKFGFNLEGAVMASDAFFPFPDCVEIASQNGIKSIVQPGGSVRDQESIDFCNKTGLAMVLTGIRHFRH